MNSNIRKINLPLELFNYNLPEEKIAFEPKKDRHSSRLLIYKDEEISEDKYINIGSYLNPGSLVVLNNTKVVHARLIFSRPVGKPVEIFCLEPARKNLEINVALQQKGEVKWRCFVGNLKKWKEPQLKAVINTLEKEIEITAEIVEKEVDSYIIDLKWNAKELSFAEILDAAGKVPLPPYINRELEEGDKQKYQTVFATQEGSVAAPTAGLHFTPEIFSNLAERNIHTDFVTLHVGAGTFKPVKSETIDSHQMHDEQVVVDKSFIQNLFDHLDKDIISVGTTSLRTIESLYWFGVKILNGHFGPNDSLLVNQWDPYNLEEVSVQDALSALLDYLKEKGLSQLTARTQIMIVPGYKWKLVDVLATNFHQPASTLIMLVAAFIGEDWKKVYDYALKNDFRFLSYGDGCLFFRKSR